MSARLPVPRFLRHPPRPLRPAAALALLTLALPSCHSDRLLAVSESVPPTLASDKDHIHFQCYFLSVPAKFDLLKQTEGVHIAGIYSPEEGEKLLTALKKRRNVDLLSSPSLTTRDGQRGTIEVIREFIYPTEYDPPRMPRQAATSEAGAFPVTPATPTSFETALTGVTAEFKGSRNRKGEIECDFVLNRRLFLGFVNYGSPITAPAKNAFGKPVEVVITENRIEMPVFDTRRIASSVTLLDGHFLAVGGLSPDPQRNLAREVRRDGGTSGFEPAEAEDNLFVLIRVSAKGRDRR